MFEYGFFFLMLLRTSVKLAEQRMSAYWARSAAKKERYIRDYYQTNDWGCHLWWPVSAILIESKMYLGFGVEVLNTSSKS